MATAKAASILVTTLSLTLIAIVLALLLAAAIYLRTVFAVIESLSDALHHRARAG